ncbi:hypothetical protein QBC47DRAFT_407127 [Echria macrotheca]|uniref:Carbonyl reductase n=1 Tax=Echria macrotheca TaxID=438768 RepID=A0AAJ0B6X7_9PEZI|nr:hypothetical protein QBC47DRAFT_407127 [Echria macrotheca]
MPTEKIIIITGANKGIGYATVKRIALTYGKPLVQDETHEDRLLIYLTARNPEKGTKALNKLLGDADLERSGVLSQDQGTVEIAFHQLDITSPSSIAQFTAFLREKHPGGIDVLINNAGVYPLGSGIKPLNLALSTNYHGTLNLTKALLPLLYLRPSGTARIVNVASTFGKFSRFPPNISKRLFAAITIDEITALMDEARRARVDRKTCKMGWNQSAYAISKAGVIAMSRALAGDPDVKSKGMLVNACCPGWTRTDMTFWMGRRSAEEACGTVVLLALGDVEGRTGLFWKDCRVCEL